MPKRQADEQDDTGQAGLDAEQPHFSFKSAQDSQHLQVGDSPSGAALDMGMGISCMSLDSRANQARLLKLLDR